MISITSQEGRMEPMSDRVDVLMIGPYPDREMRAMDEAWTVHRFWDMADKPGFLAARGASIRALATRGDLGADKALIDALPNLEIIVCFGVGTDGIDLAAARARGIRVTNTPDVLTGDVADLAIGLILDVMRAMPQGDQHDRTGAWAKGPMPLVRRFYGKKIGIAGFGRIGQAVARRAGGFDVEIGYFSRSAKPERPERYFPSLVELARWSDVLVVTLAGGGGTLDLVNRDVLAALGPEGYFVNVARGSVVDEAALLEALETKAIAGAGLDVFRNEPNIDPRFVKLSNVALQPHHASGTVETRAAMGQLVRDNLAAYFAGRPLLTPVA
jgi:lactate dehydrogenase-like 2-hydroxyacid dehydrogenase